MTPRPTRRIPATRHPRRQRGATLVVALIFLVLMSLFAISAFNTSSTNQRIVGNTQARQEAIAAAQVAIEQTISSPQFATNPEGVAANPIVVDTDNDGKPDYTVRLNPGPWCYRVAPLQAADLDPGKEADLACMSSGAATGSGIVGAGGGAGGASLCANSEWNIRAEVVDERSAARVAINQGVSMRVLGTDATNACK